MRSCRICHKGIAQDDLPNFGGPGLDTIDGAKLLALNLFSEISKRYGDVVARRIFAIWGTPPSVQKLGRIKNLGLLSLYDMTGQNAMRLARDLAKQNKKLPRRKQHGAGGTDEANLLQLINRMLKERRQAMKAGTWWGPFPPE